MVIKTHVDILVSFDKSWTKVFVGLHHDEVLVTLDIGQAQSLTGYQIRSCTSCLEELFQVVEKQGDATAEFDWNLGSWWFPDGT